MNIHSIRILPTFGLELKPCPIQDDVSQGTISSNLRLHMQVLAVIQRLLTTINSVFCRLMGRVRACLVFF
jgi:hypothetical protein